VIEIIAACFTVFTIGAIVELILILIRKRKNNGRH